MYEKIFLKENLQLLKLFNSTNTKLKVRKMGCSVTCNIMAEIYKNAYNSYV